MRTEFLKIGDLSEAQPAPRLMGAFLMMILFIAFLALVAPDPGMDQDDIGLNAPHAQSGAAS